MNNEIKKAFLMSLTDPKKQEEIIRNYQFNNFSFKDTIRNSFVYSQASKKGHVLENSIRDTFLGDKWENLQLEEGRKLTFKPDLLLVKDNTILVAEIKKRDDHDSGKSKDISYRLKITREELTNMFPTFNIEVRLMFIQDGQKNFNYYNKHEDVYQTLYGNEIFRSMSNPEALYQLLIFKNDEIDTDELLNFDIMPIALFSNEELEELITTIQYDFWTVLSPKNIFYNNMCLQLKLSTVNA